MKHPSQVQILHFLSGKTGEAEAEAMFSHLDRCAPCAERRDVLRAVTQNFEGAWDEFLQEVQVRAEAGAAEPVPALEWTLLARGLMDGTRQLASLAMEKLSGALGAGPLEVAFAPAYSGVGDPEGAGIGKMTEEASQHLKDGDADEALRILNEVVGRNPVAGASGMLEIRSEGEVVGRVVVDANRRTLSVVVDPDLLGSVQGTAVLGVAGGETRQEPLEPVPGAPYLLAEFEDVPNGELSLRLQLTSA